MIKKNLLIIGGAGYIGSVLLEKISSYNVTIFDKFLFNSVKDYKKKFCKAKIIQGDINFGLSKYHFKNIDVVIHLAGLANDPSSDYNPNNTVLTNHISTIKIAKFCKLMKVKRLIYASSCSVYGDHGKKLVNEKDELRPLTVYALSKFSSENEILKMNDKYFNVICLRFATLFGYSPRMRFDLGVNLMAKKIICNKNIIINGDGKQYRSFVHVKDVAKTLTFIADLKNNLKNNIYNVGSNKNNIKIIDLAKKLKKLFPEIKVVFEKDNKDFRSYRVDFLRLKKVININKFLSIEDGVMEVFSKFKDRNSKDLEDKKYYNLQTLKS